MNKEEITYKIPNNQIHISEIKDEDCLIWISPKALYMANTIDKLQQENKQLKEKLDCDLQWAFKYDKQLSNWNKLKEYIRKNIIYDDVGMKILDPSSLEDYIQELEQGSNSNEI